MTLIIPNLKKAHLLRITLQTSGVLQGSSVVCTSVENVDGSKDTSVDGTIVGRV